MMQLTESKNHHLLIGPTAQSEPNPFGSGGGFFGSTQNRLKPAAAYHQQFMMGYQNSFIEAHSNDQEQPHPHLGPRRERCNSGISSVTQTEQAIREVQENIRQNNPEIDLADH